MQKLPGSKALLLVPAAALIGRIDPEFLRARADCIPCVSRAPQKAPGAVSDVSTGVIAADEPARGLAGVLSQLMGTNEFASVRAYD